MTRTEIKHAYTAYRDKTRDLVTVGDARLPDPELSVNLNAHVQLMQDGSGAFVECIIWVPKEVL